MPSLCGTTKSGSLLISESMEASLMDGSSLSSVLQIIDKKVRNLEKRKGKLDGYRADYEKGKELIEDQKIAMKKYDEVIQTLDFARELSSQFKAMSIDEDKIRKKQLKKESIERSKNDVLKLSFILQTKDILRRLKNPEDLPKDFFETTTISDSEKNLLLNFSELIQTTTTNCCYSSISEHYLFLFDGKNKSVVNSTYRDLKKCILKIQDSHIFENEKIENDTDQNEGIGEQLEEEEEEEDDEEDEEQEQQKQHGVSKTLEEEEELPPAELPSNGNTLDEEHFDFMQESQIDPISMDPAVVVVHHSSGIQTQTFTNQMYITPPSLTSELSSRHHIGSHYDSMAAAAASLPNFPPDKETLTTVVVSKEDNGSKESFIPSAGFRAMPPLAQEENINSPPSITEWSVEADGDKEVGRGRGGRGGRGSTYRGRKDGFRGGRSRGRNGEGENGGDRGGSGFRGRGNYRGGNFRGEFKSGERRGEGGRGRGRASIRGSERVKDRD